MNVNHPLLTPLPEIDAELIRRFPGKGIGSGLGELGLQLDRAIDASRYDWCTPYNCRTFANTMGDGIHFSFLLLNEAITEQSPVVITDPSCGGRSAILGESLHEFLCLGVYHGYFTIAEMMNGSDSALTKYLNPPSPQSRYPDARTRMMMQFLREQLNLKPWIDRNRFRILQDTYAKLLSMPPEVLP